MIDPEILQRLEQQASLIRQLQGALGGDRIVRGVVSSAGAVSEGSGFSSVKNSAGVYVVTFSPAFSDVPSVSADPINNAITVLKLISSVTASAFGISIFAYSGGGATDSVFNFVAIGPA